MAISNKNVLIKSLINEGFNDNFIQSTLARKGFTEEEVPSKEEIALLRRVDHNPELKEIKIQIVMEAFRKGGKVWDARQALVDKVHCGCGVGVLNEARARLLKEDEEKEDILDHGPPVVDVAADDVVPVDLPDEIMEKPEDKEIIPEEVVVPSLKEETALFSSASSDPKVRKKGGRVYGKPGVADEAYLQDLRNLRDTEALSNLEKERISNRGRWWKDNTPEIPSETLGDLQVWMRETNAESMTLTADGKFSVLVRHNYTLGESA